MGRRGFTLIEVLIALVLLGMIIPALFKAVDSMRDANGKLSRHVKKVENNARVYRTLFEDIAASDGNLTIYSGRYDTLCIHHTLNTLYHHIYPNVCWGVLKDSKRLIRIEGDEVWGPPYRLGKLQEIQSDSLIPVKGFSAVRKNDEVFVSITPLFDKPISFVVQGVGRFQLKKNVKKNAKKKRLKVSK